MKNKILVVTILGILLFSSFSLSAESNEDKTLLVRINDFQDFNSITSGIEIVGRSNEWIDVLLFESDLNYLEQNKIDYEIVIWDVEAYDDSVRGSYHTLAEMEQILFDIADDYPAITDLYSLGSTCQGREVYCLEITDNPGVDEGEAGVFYMGLHHAREWPTVEICLYLADQLTSGYYSNSSIQNLVDNRRIWIVTCVNPDGYYYCHDQGYDWRKNRRYFPEFGVYGVDPNRNYAGSSNGDPWGAWGSVGTGSITHYPSQETYCGPEPFSEFETQHIRDHILNNDISAVITWHTYSELVLWPWCYSYSPSPDASYMSTVGEGIAQRITKMSGSGTYTPQQGSNLYPTTGDTVDWAYGYSHYVLGKACFAYTIEACSSFHPSDIYLDQICEQNYEGGLYLLEEAEDIKNTVTPRVIPPEIDELGEEEDYYVVSWNEQNPEADPAYFQLDELSGISLETDDAEGTPNLWNFDGFQLVSDKKHSGSNSYKARDSNSDVSSMTSVYPLPVTVGMSLSFWCWYEIEDNYDYACIEVSEDSRNFEVLDGFTGSSSGWIYKEYSLSDYVGDSIFIRFRYATDQGTLDDGFYVDDIEPIPDFSTVETLSNHINGHQFTISDQIPGEYYYRVRGYNSERGWGDFSILENVTVIEGENFPPYEPNNPSPLNGQLHVEIDIDLSWSGGDPNPGDMVFYDILFEAGDSVPDKMISDDQIATSFDLGILEYDTKYYWQIIAKDVDGLETEGPIWYFITAEESNFPPDTPKDPYPADGSTDVDIDLILSWTGSDPNEDDTLYYDIYFGELTDPPMIASDIIESSYDLEILSHQTNYYWKIVARDSKGESTEGPIWSFETKGLNNPPDIPTISGENNGRSGEEYPYTFLSSDPEDDQISYVIDWGDGDVKTIGPYQSGDKVSALHIWTERNDYTIKAKAKDSKGAESDWSYYEVSMSKNKLLSRFWFIENLLDRLPFLKIIVNNLFKLVRII